jgi:hypothetical protein
MQANLDPRGEAELEGIAPRTLGLVRDRRPPASEVLMRDLPLPGKAGEQEFLFLYDYGDEWTFTVRLLEWNETIDPHAIYPRIVASLGEPPDQYPYVPDPWGGDDDMDDESGGNVLLNFPAPKPVSDR